MTTCAPATAAGPAASRRRDRAARSVGLALALGLLLGSCASTEHPCRTGRTGGWLSGWGGGGGSSIAIGLHRTWWDCPESAPSPSSDPR